MMKLILVAVLVLLLSVDQSWAKGKGKGKGKGKNDECGVRTGKRLVTFGGTPELVKFPCKYTAIRQTVCGKWKVTITPGNELENERHKHYVIRSLWVGVERIKDGKQWGGRSDLKIARKYLYGLKDVPFNKKEGQLDIKDVFKFDDSNKAEITLTEKTGDFKISYGLYDPFGRWNKASTFNFQCLSDNFEPSAYPNQLCGNTTRQEVKKFKQNHLWKENRMATLFFNVFTDSEVIQTDANCQAAQNTMSNRCVKNGVDLRYKAANLCWPILAQPKYQYCISRNMDSPISTFRHCVEYVCSDYKDNKVCRDLGKEMDLCPKLKEVSDIVKDKCKPDLHSQ